MSDDIVWMALHPRATVDHLGFIPSFLHLDDPRPAAEQFRERYIGGWRPMRGFILRADGHLDYTGDPTLTALWQARFHDELVTVYQSAFVRITQPNGAWEVSRMD